MAAVSGVAPRAVLGRLTSPMLVGFIAVVIYSINLNYTPLFDELYHVLGARGYLQYGEPRIADGVYTRTSLFTALIAVLFEQFGESIVVARLPSVFAGGVMVACMFIWTRAVAGTATAWLSTIPFLVSPFAIEIFQFARFYALQALLFWLGAVATYGATAGRRPLGQMLLLAMAAAVCFAGAFYLHMVTAMGLVGVGLWLAVSVALPWVGALTPEKRRIVLVGVPVVTVILAFIVLSMFGAELLQRYRWTPAWATPARNHFWFYHFWLDLYYPTLWPLFPLAALAALAHKPKPALFSLCIFVPALLLSSFGGMKDLDYMFYTFPFLFIVWGMAFAFIMTRLRKLVVDVAGQGIAALGIAPKQWVVTTVVACAGGFIILANTASVRAVAMLAGITVPPEVKPPDWAAAAEGLRPWLEQASVVLTTSDIETLYFLGDYDVLINKGRLSEVPEKVEFGRDPRTGRPIVSTLASVALIIDCFPDGLIVTSKHRWRVPSQLEDPIADHIIRRADPIELPTSSLILAFHWERPPGAVAPATCADLPIRGNRGPGSSAVGSDH